ncbi:hypothetical protein [Nonomuraea sp. CA-141351]|uniref:hypothetical protein n=1 Tax=Nonomuraea sp. CA-141351 TaxID=3239996 RepID=UPI003D8D2815
MSASTIRTGQSSGDAEAVTNSAEGSYGEMFQLMAWRWNVSHAKKLTADRTPGGRVEVAAWAGLLQLIHIDDEHAQQVDLSEPLIVVPVPNGGLLVIDGWHRIRKALTSGVKHLLAHVLSVEEELACRVHGGEKGEGWIR